MARARPTPVPEATEVTAAPFQVLFGASNAVNRMDRSSDLAATAVNDQTQAPVPSMAEAVQAISFGAGGTDVNYLDQGWSGDEPGHRWTIGQTSELWLEHPRMAGDFRLELDLSPFCHAPDLPRQRLTVRVRGAIVGRATIATRGTVAFRVPEALLAGAGPVRVQFEHRDARAPSHFGGTDDRVLALCFYRLLLRRCAGGEQDAGLQGGYGLTVDAIARETGIAAADYMLRFESLGDNCEFGLVQRLCGAEPMGLLRFANINLPNLLRALASRFDKLGDPKNLVLLHPNGKRQEYKVRDSAYGLVYHTWQRPGMCDPQALLAEQVSRLHFLRRKLLEDLTEARKVFVWKRNDATSEAEARALHAALLAYGPNTLLWVTEPDPASGDMPGVVKQVAPGLFHGTTDLVPSMVDTSTLALDLWLSLCVEVDRMRIQTA
jgi:hypothetical protein